ncbi:MAG: phosphotransferase, partial [Actinobacteria bacterium]|nr:phosphotransferase [Actinomycetota bacterium]
AGTYLQTIEILGTRTAQLHLALASDLEDPAFAPEPFTTLYQRSLYQSMRNLTRKSFQLLRRQLSKLDEPERVHAERLVAREGDVLERFRSLTTSRIDADRIRIHGDYHLGQVLFTGNDFVIIDFEGEPLRSLGERRIKRSGLRDVAGMIRSFHYAAYAGLFDQVATGLVLHGDHLRQIEEWARTWYAWTSATFLHHYLATAAGASFVPEDSAQLRVLLESLLLEKSIYELSYELNNRPTWLHIPLQGALQLVEAPQ